MNVVEGERVSLRTLECIGFRKATESKTNQVWTKGNNMVCLNRTENQKPLVLWIRGMVAYMTIPRDTRNPNRLKMKPFDIVQKLKAVEDGGLYARALLG